MSDGGFVAPEDLPYAKDLVTVLPYTESLLREKVFQAIGAASSCWDNLSGAGVFESELAAKVGEELMKDIIGLTRLGQASLGCATNKELETELHTRAQFGHTEPDYRTVDG